jgi:hypothetical protein
MSYSTTISTAATNTAAFISVGTNGLSATTEFASYAARWQMFRVSGCRLTFMPRYPQFGTSSTAASQPDGVLCLADDRDGDTPNPTSIAGLWAWSNAKLYTWDKKFTYDYRPDDFEDSPWYPVIGSIPQLWRIVAGISNPATLLSVVIFDVFVEYAVEFKGTQ